MLKKTFLKLIAATLLIAPLNLAAKTEKYIIDKHHTKIGFSIAHLVISEVEGKFDDFDGWIMFDSDKLDQKSAASFKTEFSVQVKSVDTGVEKRDDHLRTADFFDAKKYPTMTFVSDTITVKGKKKFELTGKLKIRDITKSVTFEVKYKGKAVAYDKTRVAFSAETEIVRKDFGLLWNDVVEAGPVVGDTATVELEIQAIRAADL